MYSSMRVLQYSYKPSMGKLLLGLPFFGIGAVWFFREYQTNGRGLILNHIIELSPRNASFFYLGLSVFCCLFVVLGLFAILGNLGGPKQLTLTDAQLTVPNSLYSSKLKTVKVSDIQGLRLVSMRGRYLYVYHPGGTVRITEEYFPSGAAFDELCQALAYLTQRRAAEYGAVSAS
jgi:hypothetical protein